MKGAGVSLLAYSYPCSPFFGLSRKEGKEMKREQLVGVRN